MKIWHPLQVQVDQEHVKQQRCYVKCWATQTRVHTHTHTQATSLEVMSCLQLRKYIDPICIHQCKPRYQHRHQVEHEKGIPKGYHWSSGQIQRVFPSQINYLVGEFDDTLGYSYIYLGFSEVIHHFSSVQRKLHRRL